MKLLIKSLLFALLFHSVYAQENYILNKKGEKIQIGNGPIFNSSGNKTSYTKYEDPNNNNLKKTLSFFSGNRRQYKTKFIDKVVCGKRLYKVFKTKKSCILFRQIAQNNKFVFGHSKYIVQWVNSKGKSKSKERNQYLILDNNQKLYFFGEIFDKKGNLTLESIEKIKHYFPNCLNLDSMSEYTILRTNQIQCN